MDVDAAELGHQPVGDLGRNATHHEIVDALLAPSANDVIPSTQLLEEERDVIGIVLQIAVHSQNELALTMIKPGRKRRGLPEIATQLDHNYAAVHSGNLLEQRE